MEASQHAGSQPETHAPPTSRPRKRRIWPLFLLAVPISVGFGALWFNAPLDEAVSTTDVRPTPRLAAPNAAPSAATDHAPAAWPQGRIEGDVAKKYLLEFLLAALERIENVDGYTAIFQKQERIGDKIGPPQTMDMKIRHQPFSVYLKYLSPKPGREALYVQGKHDNKLIAHNNDLSALLIPRLALDPEGRIALADNRHPITEIGLANLIRKLISFRRLDLEDSDAQTILDRVTDESGHEWYRSLHLHTQQNPERPFQRIEVLYDTETKLPRQLQSHDWPKPGETGELALAERYNYSEVKLNAPLSDEDFSTANPQYAFQRRLGKSSATK
jgi:Protein of unknown function (DUF1571)